MIIGKSKKEIEKMRAAGQLVGHVLHELRRMVEPGIPTIEIDRAAEKMIRDEDAEAHDYSVVRDYVGHGIGRQMHEDPQIPNYGKPGQGPKIKTGYVFAVEPMINLGGHYTKVLSDGWTVVTLDGQPSAHAEHTIAITAEGPDVLTRVATVGQ